MNVSYGSLYQQIDPAVSWAGRRLSGKKTSQVPQGEPPRMHRAWRSAVIFSLWKFGICESEHTRQQTHCIHLKLGLAPWEFNLWPLLCYSCFLSVQLRVSISEACAHALLRVGFLLKFFSSPSPSLSDRQIRQQFALFSLSCPAGCWIKPLTALLAQSRISLHAFNAWRWSSSV